MHVRITVEANKYKVCGGWEYNNNYDGWEERWDSLEKMKEFYAKEFDWEDLMDFDMRDIEGIIAWAAHDDGDTLFKLTATLTDEEGKVLHDNDGEEIKLELTDKWASEIARGYCDRNGIDLDDEEDYDEDLDEEV